MSYEEDMEDRDDWKRKAEEAEVENRKIHNSLQSYASDIAKYTLNVIPTLERELAEARTTIQVLLDDFFPAHERVCYCKQLIGKCGFCRARAALAEMEKRGAE